MAIATKDLPKISIEDDRLCSVCGETQGEEAFTEDQWFKARWRTCIACQADEKPLPPPESFVRRVWTTHYDACINCHKVERGHAGRGLCIPCYALSGHPGYTGPLGPKLDRRATSIEQRRVVDAFLAMLPPVTATPVLVARTAAEPVIEVRTCAKCKEARAEDAFWPSMWSKNDARRWCKSCSRIDKQTWAASKQQLATGPAAPIPGGIAPPAPPAPPHPVVVAAMEEAGRMLDEIAPPEPPAAFSRTVADALRALLDGLARERAALEEERTRVNARLEKLRCQVGAVETTLALVTP